MLPGALVRDGGRAGDGKNSTGEVLIQHYYFSHVLLEEPYLHGDTYNLICLVHEFLFSLFWGGQFREGSDLETGKYCS